MKKILYWILFETRIGNRVLTRIERQTSLALIEADGADGGELAWTNADALSEKGDGAALAETRI